MRSPFSVFYIPFLSIYFLSSVLSFSWTLYVVTKPSATPIILVPGDGGSQIEAKLNKPGVVHYVCVKQTHEFDNIWLNMEELVPFIIDCWIDNMKLVYDNVTRTTSNSPGVETRVPGFGGTYSVEWLDPSQASEGAYFNEITSKLVSLGSERNVSLRGAPYDFRKGPNESGDFFKNLKDLVEETYELNDNKPVVFIAHSMGAPMTLHFLQAQSKSWKDQYIRALVTLNGAWAGSVKALKVFLVGDNLGSRTLSASDMRHEQITSPSLAWLIPSSLFWTHDEILVQTDQMNYTVNDYEQFFDDIDYSVGWEMRKDVAKYSLNFEPPDVEVHCLHGQGVDTIDKIVYKKGDFPDNPSYIYGEGDGTVNKRSLEACLNWQGKQKKKVYHQTFSNVDHLGILHNQEVVDYITSVFMY